MEMMIKIVSFMGIIGIPTIFSMFVFCIRYVVILAKAQQAQMRNDLIKDYLRYTEQGWVSVDEASSFDLAYQRYHALGHNGFLTEKHADVMKLPNTPPRKVS